MNLFLNDNDCKTDLLPFTATRHVSELRIGILTIREKWKLLLDDHVNFLFTPTEGIDIVEIPANVIPTKDNFSSIIELSKSSKQLPENDTIRFIHFPWNIFQLNDFALRKDFDLLTQNRISAKMHSTNYVVNDKDVFVEEGAALYNCSLNASTGPIYIGKNATIMEGSLIRGPFSLGENSVVKMGAKIYGATTIGPHCVAGGEIKNSILFEYSNKAHDGYLGDSVIGAWCNLGAGTSNSNVKNTGEEVSFQIDLNKKGVKIGNKGGLLMGDYSRSAINTCFNTGSTIGVCCNIFTQGFPKKHLPHFSWGNEKYKLEKAFRDIDNWKKMKNKNITLEEKELLTTLFSTNK